MFVIWQNTAQLKKYSKHETFFYFFYQTYKKVFIKREDEYYFMEREHLLYTSQTKADFVCPEVEQGRGI